MNNCHSNKSPQSIQILTLPVSIPHGLEWAKSVRMNSARIYIMSCSTLPNRPPPFQPLEGEVISPTNHSSCWWNHFPSPIYNLKPFYPGSLTRLGVEGGTRNTSCMDPITGISVHSTFCFLLTTPIASYTHTTVELKYADTGALYLPLT